MSGFWQSALFSSLFIFSGEVSASRLLPRAFSIGQSVQTTSGAIVGHAAQTRTQVSEYLGIPYAQPPVGNLRFAAPKKFQGNGTITASTFSPDCPANTGSGSAIGSIPGLAGTNAIRLLAELAQYGNQQSEDCLTLNIWTKPQTGEKSKAVLVWLYGGGFATGATNNIGYNGQYFADNQDVVVVSVNYRINVFGFPGLPGASTPQNPGLLDQRLAIEWVRDNIASFGGDPKRITLFGQSAGGASVDFYSYAYTQDPIVNAFIPESGTVNSFFNAADNTQAWFTASQKLGCGDAAAGLEQSITCMRTKSTQELLAAIAVDNPLRAILGSFGPTIDNQVVFSDYASRAANGQFIKRPYLTGSNNYEAGLFRIFGAGANISDVEWCLMGLETFTCPASRAASARALASVPTYRYRYYGEFPNTRLTFNPNSGAWHGSEIPVVWGTAEDASGAANTAAEASISSYLQGLWANFAKDPDNALAKAPYKFPKFNAFAPSLIKFAENNSTSPAFSFPVETDLLCPILEAIEAQIPGGLTGSLFTTGNIADLSTIPGLSSIPNIDNLLNLLNQFTNKALPNPSKCPIFLG